MPLDRQKIEKIISLTSDFNPSLIGIFGSYARGEETKSSDLDILIDFRQKINLLELIGIEQLLSEELGLKVDLVTKKSLNRMLEPIILKELKVIHEG